MSNISMFKSLEIMKSNPYFKCTFVKKDKSLRNMICSFEESQKLDSSLVLVWDIENNDYRQVNLNTLKTLTIKGQCYKVV